VQNALLYAFIVTNASPFRPCNAVLSGSSAQLASKQKSFQNVCSLDMGVDAEVVLAQSGVGCARPLCVSI
jgi:hypothetical protein